MIKKWRFHVFKHIPGHEIRITVSTAFTLLRIILVPFVAWSMRAGSWGYALFLFFIAVLSDGIDGSLARWWNDQTVLGACLDPIADKLLIVVCFCTFSLIESPLFVIPDWFVFFIIIKEMIVLVGATVIYVKKRGLLMRPTWLGKSAAVLQMSFIMWLLICYFFRWGSNFLYYYIFACTLLVMCAALIHYVYLGVNQLMKHE